MVLVPNTFCRVQQDHLLYCFRGTWQQIIELNKTRLWNWYYLSSFQKQNVRPCAFHVLQFGYKGCSQKSPKLHWWPIVSPVEQFDFSVRHRLSFCLLKRNRWMSAAGLAAEYATARKFTFPFVARTCLNCVGNCLRSCHVFYCFSFAVALSTGRQALRWPYHNTHTSTLKSSGTPGVDVGQEFFVAFVEDMPQSWRSGRRDLPAKDPGGPPAKFFPPRKRISAYEAISAELNENYTCTCNLSANTHTRTSTHTKQRHM